MTRESRLSLRPRAYRWIDRLTKLTGVGLVAAGLEVGGATPAGLGLGIAGVAIAVCTVFVDRTPDR